MDLSAEAGGNCEYTEAGKLVTTPSNVSVVGFTDLPSRMATQVRAVPRHAAPPTTLHLLRALPSNTGAEPPPVCARKQATCKSHARARAVVAALGASVCGGWVVVLLLPGAVVDAVRQQPDQVPAEHRPLQHGRQGLL